MEEIKAAHEQKSQFISPVLQFDMQTLEKATFMLKAIAEREEMETFYHHKLITATVKKIYEQTAVSGTGLSITFVGYDHARMVKIGLVKQVSPLRAFDLLFFNCV